jgi:hypothetical protein
LVTFSFGGWSANSDSILIPSSSFFPWFGFETGHAGHTTETEEEEDRNNGKQSSQQLVN